MKNYNIVEIMTQMNAQKPKGNMMKIIKTSSIWLFFIVSGFVYSQPGGDWIGTDSTGTIFTPFSDLDAGSL